MALGVVKDTELREASGLNNLSRNLGGAIGIALVNTWLLDYARLRGERLWESLAASPGRAAAALIRLEAHFATRLTDPAHQLALAASALRRQVEIVALTEAFADVFRVCALLFVVSLAIIPFCRSGSLTGAGH